MQTKDPPAMPALIPASAVELSSATQKSKIQKQVHLVKQLKTMLEKEKWRLAGMLGEYHSRNRMRKILEAEERSCKYKEASQLLDDRVTREHLKRRRLNISSSVSLIKMSSPDTPEPW